MTHSMRKGCDGEEEKISPIDYLENTSLSVKGALGTPHQHFDIRKAFVQQELTIL